MVAKRRHTWDVLVVGAGIGGLTAAWQCARRGLATALLECGTLYGGQVATIDVLLDWPATTPTSGAALAASLADEARRAGVEILHHAATALVPGAPEATIVRVETTGGRQHARRVVVATGGERRRLGVAREDELLGKGVSHCADCDGPLFRGQDVVVVGGGDAALQQAVILARSCRQVVIVARSALSARRSLVERALSADNVRIEWNCLVEAILGEDLVSGVRLRDRTTGACRDLPCTGLFPFIGTTPITAFVPPTIARDALGRLVTDDAGRTASPLVYAIGAVRAGCPGDLLAVTGDAASATAAIAAELL